MEHTKPQESTAGEPESPDTAASATTTEAGGRHEEEATNQRQSGATADSPPVEQDEEPVRASGRPLEAEKQEREESENVKASSAEENQDGQAQQGGEEGKKDEASSSGDAAASSSYFDAFLKGRPPKEAAIAWAKDFQVGLKDAFADLFGLKEKSTGMKKHIYQQGPSNADKKGDEEEAEDEAPNKENVGGGALVVVKTQQKTWERLAEQLKDAPIIQEILKAGTKLADTELGRQAGKLRGKLKDGVEDAREMWETSQNPLVYKLSSVWDDLTSETELGIALREIRRADPDFVLEDWVSNLAETFLPQFFEAYLKGDLKRLKPYLSEGMYKQMSEEFRLRKAEGLALDSNVLEISNAEIVQAKMHDHQPVLVLGTLFQHINCVRNREGKIVEGKEDEVRASFYLLLFVREFNEEEGALEWKLSERYLGFSQPFI